MVAKLCSPADPNSSYNENDLSQDQVEQAELFF